MVFVPRQVLPAENLNTFEASINALLALGALSYRGEWNASTNAPTLESGAGTKGSFYTVTTAGSTDLDGIDDWHVGDKVLFNGDAWERLGGAVTSVAGLVGAISSAALKTALELVLADISDAGALAAADDAGDVPFTPAGSIAATNVQVAIEELDTEKAPTSHDHDADYAAIGHDHDGDYAALGHNHDGSYAALGHDHDADYEPLNADILKADESDDLQAGYTATSADQGTKTTGTFTPAFADRNIQHCVNGGAFTLGVPTGHGSLVLDITNNGSAGAITTSGYTLVTGDAFTATNTHKFRCFITCGNAGSHLHVVAFQ